jgi:Ca-activated chloride channel family protein
MIFADAHNTLYFISLPIAVVIFWIGYKKRKAGLSAIIHPQLWERVVPSIRLGRRFFRMGLWLLALTFIIVALLRPQYGLKYQTIQRKGQDIFIAIDTSKSMLAKDIMGMSRFDYAKQEIKGLIKNLKGDRVGLIIFSGDAFIQSPLTLDYGALNLFLDDIQVGSVPVPGTDIATAIKTARLSFEKTSKLKKKILVIISDGESFENDPIKSAEVASKGGIIIYTVSLGSITGEPIPLPDAGYKKDTNNQIVVSKANQSLLKTIAEKTGGDFFSATSYGVLDAVYKAIFLLEKQLLEESLYQSHEDQYQPVLAMAFLLLILELLIPDRVKGPNYEE